MLVTTLLARHISDCGGKRVPDFSLTESSVPKLGHQAVDRLGQEGPIGPGVGLMKGLYVLSETPHDVRRPQLPSVVRAIGVKVGHA